MEYKRITIVDENDAVIGFEDFPKAIAEGMIKRASNVYVFDTEGKLLIQKRSARVRCPLLFDCSASGHVDEGESYYDAALREMYEEIGLGNGVVLTEVVLSYKTPESFVGIYKAVVTSGTTIVFDTHEIESVAWVMPDEVDVLVRMEPPVCTPSFIQTWSELRDTLTT